VSPIDTVLPRLCNHRLRKRSADQWSAQCPAHKDRGPSLSVRELRDGRVLLHCFAGCHVDEVIGALGLEVADLFPPRSDTGGGAPPVQRRRLLSAGQALDLLESEAALLFVLASDLALGVPLDDETRARLITSAARVSMLRDEVQA
jgi:hypothetical protein